MKAIFTAILLAASFQANAWQTFNATTIGPNGPQFTFGQIQGYGNVQQFNTTTINPRGGVGFGFGNVNRYRNVDQFNYYEYGGSRPPRATFGNVYRQMLPDED